MYSWIDLVIIAVLCVGIGVCIGVALLSICVAAGESQKEKTYRLRETHYKEIIYNRDIELREKSKFIARFRHKCIEIVQQYLQDDVPTCTMIVASINGIKEKDGAKG